MLPTKLADKLSERKSKALLRELKIVNPNLIDFSSNDYLGFAKTGLLQQAAIEKGLLLEQASGSTGSRLLSGQNKQFLELEDYLAQYFNVAAALVFNSGYDANLGLCSALAQRTDSIFYDELVHASIRDGLRLSFAKASSFKHNDLDHLRSKIKLAARGNIYIVLESVYSMDGDCAPLVDFVKLSAEHQAYLIVDEAHATGVFGKEGRGLVDELDLGPKIFARVHTFGKALGCHGAVVLGSQQLKEYLINFSRPFIYSTALAPHSLLYIKAALELLARSVSQRQVLQALINYFSKQLGELEQNASSSSAIQTIACQGNQAVKKLSAKLEMAGLDVRAILSPTVPRGQERLRICLHAFNSRQEIDRLLATLKNEAAN